jgi:hypothetical protein
MVLPDPGTPRFGYQPQSRNNDVGKRFFEAELTADPAKRIAAKLADITGTLKRCGAGQRDRNLPVPPHRTSWARTSRALGLGLRIHIALICSAHP